MPHPSPDPMGLVGPFPLQPMYFRNFDAILYNKILTQVEYYFSADNLSRDEHLRDQMNDEGWVPVRVIAAFRRVSGFPSSILKLTCVNHFTMSTAESISYCIKVLLILVVFVCLRDLGSSSLSLVSVLVVKKRVIL
jgi:hypothetical protein